MINKDQMVTLLGWIAIIYCVLVWTGVIDPTPYTQPKQEQPV